MFAQCVRAGLALSLLGGVACSSPTTPQAPLPLQATGSSPLLGAWSGYSHITSCTPSGISYCRTVGYTYRFTMLITEEAGVVTGRFEATTPSTYAATMTGAKDGDGSVLFTPVPAASGSVRMNSLRARFDPVSGLTATFSYTIEESKPVSTMAITSVIKAASRSGTAPPFVGSTSDFIGSWIGMGSYESCSNPSGFGCGGSFPRVREYYLTIQSTASGLEAVMDPGIANWPLVRMSGAPQPDGSVIFAGRETGTMPSGTVSHAEVKKLQLWIDPNSGLMGSFDGELGRTNGSDTQHMRVLNGRRAAVSHSPGPLQGGWSGQYVVRECTGPSCSTRGAIGRTYSFSLTLSQSASTLTGMFQDLPISGNASGVNATLGGESIATTCPYDWEGIVCSRRVRNLTTTVDSFGQMHGSFEYFEQGNHSGAYEFTVRVDLLNVIRRQ